MQPSPPFDDALVSFKAFLRSQDVSDSLRWIWRDAIISKRGSGSRYLATRPIYLDVSRLATESDVRAYYDTGVERNLGISLAVFCVADGAPFCFVDLPDDETDASYKMMGSLKFAIPDPPPTATIIRNPLLASVMRFFIRIPASAWTINNIPMRPSNAPVQRVGADNMVFTQGRGFVVGKSFGWSRQSLPSHDLTELNSRLFRDRNLNVAAVLLIVSAVPWLVPWHWRSAVVGIATVVTALSLYLRSTAARLLLPVLVGVSSASRSSSSSSPAFIATASTSATAHTLACNC